MAYLLDTNVVSELRKARSGRASERVVQWAAGVSVERLFISVITVLEIEIGILRLERKDPRQGAILRRWMEQSVLPAFDARTLAVCTNTALRCARLHVPNPRSERDALIAATAMEHDLMVVTRNTEDFHSLPVRLLNPWDEA